MDLLSAVEILKKNKNKTIASCYDDNDDIQEALLLLDEGFEYPEVSHMKIGQWLKQLINTTHFKALCKWPG